MIYPDPTQRPVLAVLYTYHCIDSVYYFLWIRCYLVPYLNATYLLYHLRFLSSIAWTNSNPHTSVMNCSRKFVLELADSNCYYKDQNLGYYHYTKFQCIMNLNLNKIRLLYHHNIHKVLNK